MIRRALSRARFSWAPTTIFWLFMAGSAAYLGWLGLSDLNLRLADGVGGVTNTAIFRINDGAESWTAPLLTYTGLTGSMLAVAEAAIVLAALALSLSSRRTLRLPAKLTTLGWASLWTASATMFAQKSGDPLAWALAAAYAIPLAATAIVITRPRRRKPTAGPSLRTRVRLNRDQRSKLRNLPSGEATPYAAMV